MPDLLLELFSEEIPARMQARAAEDLQKLVSNGLVDAGLTYSAAAAFATPRRLALTLTDLPAMTPHLREERKGPRVDAPEKALGGFLRATGLTKDQLEARDDKKGQIWFAILEKPGRPAAEVIAEVVEATIRAFPWPKSMRWGAGTLRWVRPLHSILCILTDDHGAHVVPLEVDGIKAGDTAEGHRFHAPARFRVTGFEDYQARLLKAHVILDPAERQTRIAHDAEHLAFAQGMEVVEDKGLMAEVAGLVEWPVALMGDIAPEFLDLPPQVLQTSMKEHQKFFSVRNPKTGRIEKFITVANRKTADHGATILAGNQKVLAARLSDAKFFWENDLRTVKSIGLEGMAKPLENVTFHAKLGTQAERVKRIEALAREIAPLVGAKPDLAAEAARVAKADLASEMVYEFPELQGVMGRYYAEKAGHDDGVPTACQMHYAPLGPSDDVPTEPVSVAVALADKIDVLTGFWAIDEKPTGSKDPYALRRAALGVIRIALENRVRINLVGKISIAVESHIGNYDFNIFETFKYSTDTYPDNFEMLNNAMYGTGSSYVFSFDGLSDKFMSEIKNLPSGGDISECKSYEEVRQRVRIIHWIAESKTLGVTADVTLEEDALPLSRSKLLKQIGDATLSVSSSILAFFADRLKVHLRAEGVRNDVIDAYFQLGGQDDLVLLVNRVNALQKFVETNDGANLLAGYKRASNIVEAEQKKDGVEYSLDPSPRLAEPGEETNLFAALDAAEAAIGPALEAEDFAAAMTAMASLRAPIDAFFDKVTVNAENATIRRNRLCLLNRVRAVMHRVAIFSAIEG